MSVQRVTSSFSMLATYWMLAGGLLGQDDVADIPSEKVQIGNNPKKTYFLIHAPNAAEQKEKEFNLLLVLPGGDGSEAFLPFVKRIFKYALNEDYLVAQLVRVMWSENQQIIWPDRTSKVPNMKFATEEFIERVIEDARKKYKVNPKHVFTMSWSSGGPPVYAASLQRKKSITGSYIIMSVFFPDRLPPLKYAKGYAYYIEHSPEDTVCPFATAQEAKKLLAKNGATVEFVTYAGGHAWTGDAFPRIKAAMSWLESR